MQPYLSDGWLRVGYDGDDHATIHIAVGSDQDWQPAFRDYDNGRRVVQVRTPDGVTGRQRVWLRVNGAVTGPGVISL